MNTKTTVINQEQLEAQFAFCDKILSESIKIKWN